MKKMKKKMMKKKRELLSLSILLQGSICFSHEGLNTYLKALNFHSNGSQSLGIFFINKLRNIEAEILMNYQVLVTRCMRSYYDLIVSFNSPVSLARTLNNISIETKVIDFLIGGDHQVQIFVKPVNP